MSQTQRLSASDAAFLYGETASGPMHIASVVVLEGELDFAKVFRHFEDRIHLIPSYRKILAQVPFNLSHPTWVDDPNFDLANHVIHHALPEGTDLKDAIDAAVELNEPLLDRSQPLWKFYVLTGVPDRTVLLQSTHHCMIDGASGIELQAIIYDFSTDAESPVPPNEPWTPEPAPTPDRLMQDALSENLDAMAQREWRMPFDSPEQQAHLTRGMGVMSNFVSQPVITAPFNAGLVGPKRSLSWMQQSFTEIREIRRALGGTINDVVLTVVSGAVAEYLAEHGEETTNQYIRIMCPVNVRTEDQKGALGNQVSAIFPRLPVWRMDAVQRLSIVRGEMDRIKANQEAQAMTLMQENVSDMWPVAMWPTQLVGTPWDPTQLAAMIPPLPMPSGFRPPHLSYNFTCTNVPGAQVTQYMCGHPIIAQIGLLILNNNVGFSVTVLSYNQNLYFGFICEPRLMPNIDLIAQAGDETFQTLLATARAKAEQ